MRGSLHKMNEKTRRQLEVDLADIETALSGVRSMASVQSRLLDAVFDGVAPDIWKVPDSEAENLIFVGFEIERRIGETFSQLENCLRRLQGASLTAQVVGHDAAG